MTTAKLFFYIRVFAIFGIILSVYLLFQQIFRPSFEPCNVSNLINCDAVISGPVAKTFGIPTPLYGLIGYIVILIAVFRRQTKLLLTVAFFGLFFCLWIAYIELFQLKVICPVCILCQATMLSIFLLSLKVYRDLNVKPNTTG